MATEEVSQSPSSELGAWRETHGILLEAVKVAQEAVAAQKARRRFWTEEICANIGEDGQLVSTSIWKRPLPLKKGATGVTKRYSTSKQKKKKEAATTEKGSAKKPRKRKTEEKEENEEAPRSKPKKIKITLKRPASATTETDESADEDTGDIPHAQPILGADYGPYGHGPPTHTPHQWPQQGSQSLQMMAAVAFGAGLANNAPYPPQHPPPQHSPPPPGMLPPQQPYHHPYMAHGLPPHGAQPVYHPQGGRTYADINDVGQSEDESDQEKF